MRDFTGQEWYKRHDGDTFWWIQRTDGKMFFSPDRKSKISLYEYKRVLTSKGQQIFEKENDDLIWQKLHENGRIWIRKIPYLAFIISFDKKKEYYFPEDYESKKMNKEERKIVEEELFDNNPKLIAKWN